MHTPIRVLFVCDGESTRSKMAEALLRSLGDARFAVHSAGIEAEAVNPAAIAVMQESNIPLDAAPVAALNDFEQQQFDYVISLCDAAKSACLSFPRDGENLHWTVASPDPAASPEQQQQRYRQMRDQLRQHITTWLARLPSSPSKA